MRISDVPHYRPIVGSAVSNDGRWVAAVSPRFDEERGRRLSELCLCDLRSGRAVHPIDLGDGAEGVSPSFSPDSRWLAFILREGVEEHVALLDLDALEAGPRPLSATPDCPSALKWAGDRVTCLGNDPEGWRRVWRLDSDGAQATPLTPKGKHAGDFAFRPDAEAMVWLRIPTLDESLSEEVQLDAWDKATGAHVSLELPGYPVGFLGFSPDGKYLAYQVRPRGKLLHQAQLWILDWNAGPASATEISAQIQGWITGYDWNEDSSGIYLGLVEGTLGTIVELGLDGAERSRIQGRDTYYSGPHCDRQDGVLIHLHQSGDGPQRLSIREGRDRPSESLLDFNDMLQDVELISARTHGWSPAADVECEGLLYLPKTESPPPLIVWLHGGPAEHIAHTFSPYFQVFAAAGFGVFCPNYRGSSGRDDAFLQANVGKLGQIDVDDVLSGVDSLITQGLVDGERIHAIGWSYGGSLALLTAMASKVFRSLIVGAPVVDWVSFFGSRKLPSLYRDYFPTPLWEDRTAYDQASPLTHIGKLEADTLIFHGARDPIVDVSQSRLLYRVLKARERRTDLMVYPDEGHVPAQPKAVRDMLERMLKWMKEASA